MRFSSFSLLALSSLFISSIAAPAPAPCDEFEHEHGSNVNLINIESRGQQQIIEIMTTLVTTVKTYTGSINATMEECPCKVEEDVFEYKANIIEAVQENCEKMVTAISGACYSISRLEVVQLAETDLQTLACLIAELLEEIVCTLLGVLAVLKCTILELLGSILATLCSALFSLITIVCTHVFGFVACIQQELSSRMDLICLVFSSFRQLLNLLTGI